MDNQHDPIAYRVDPNFDLAARQKRYPIALPPTERPECEAEAANDDAIPEAA